MALGFEALAAVAFLHQVFSHCQSSRPIETVAESFGYYRSCGCVMAALALMIVLEQLEPLVWLDTALEDASGAAMDKLVVDDCVCAKPALNLPSLNFNPRKSAIHQKITERLRLGRSGYYYQDGSSDGLECFSECRADCVLYGTVSPRADDSSPWNAVGSPWCCRLC